MRDTIDGINEKGWERAMAEPIELLSCGHPESEHSPITRGWAIKQDGTKICYDCAHSQELANLKTSQHYCAYLTRKDGHLLLTTWVGWTLATVTESTMTTLSAFGHRHSRVYFRAIDVHGTKWYGNSPGEGMYARMHRAKA